MYAEHDWYSLQEGVCEGELSCNRSTTTGLKRYEYNALEGIGQIRKFWVS